MLPEDVRWRVLVLEDEYQRMQVFEKMMVLEDEYLLITGLLFLLQQGSSAVAEPALADRFHVARHLEKHDTFTILNLWLWGTSLLPAIMSLLVLLLPRRLHVLEHAPVLHRCLVVHLWLISFLLSSPYIFSPHLPCCLPLLKKLLP